jgi:hypothetical protein
MTQSKERFTQRDDVIVPNLYDSPQKMMSALSHAFHIQQTEHVRFGGYYIIPEESPEFDRMRIHATNAEILSISRYRFTYVHYLHHASGLIN